MNHRVFKNPVEMMGNIRRITEHILHKLQEQDPALALRQLVVVDTEDGTGCYKDENGNFWRAYNRVEKAVTYDTLESPHLVYEAAPDVAMPGAFGLIIHVADRLLFS